MGRGRPRCVQRVLYAGLFLFHLDFRRGSNFDDGNAAGQLGQPLLQLLAIIIPDSANCPGHSTAVRDPGVMKTLKRAPAKSFRAPASPLRDGNAAAFATADPNPLRGSKALSS